MVPACTSFVPLSKSASSVSAGSLIYKIGLMIFLLKINQGNLCKALNTVSMESTLRGFTYMSKNYVQYLEQCLAYSKHYVSACAVTIIPIITIRTLSLLLLVLQVGTVIHSFLLMTPNILLFHDGSKRKKFFVFSSSQMLWADTVNGKFCVFWAP